MTRLSLRIADDLYEKLRWLAFRERKSMHAIIVGLLETALKDVEVPEEMKK